MADAEAVILEELARLAPLGGLEGADWEDVLRRANLRRGAASSRRRRRLALAFAFVALAVAVAVSPLGAAIGHGFSDFSAWLTGSPGKPASRAAQQAFDRANAHAWAGFPAATELRRLITVRRDGVGYTLSGFRDADSLCLTLTADGLASASAYSCAPLTELRARPQPALVLAVDQPIGTIPGRRVRIGPDTYTRARASVSFGIVADGVRAVALRSDDGTRRAIVRSDSFLSVAVRPKVGSLVREIAATMRDGTTVAIPFAQTPFDSSLGSAPVGKLHGPSRVDRVVHGGSIGWLDRREPRGQPLPPVRGPFPNGGRLVFGRLLDPAPGSGLKIGIELYRVTHVPAGFREQPGLRQCSILFAHQAQLTSCVPVSRGFFAKAPFSFGATGFGADQYVILAGVASDQVARLRVFLGTGEVGDVPLRANAYVARVSQAKFPIRVVGYDDHGRVIGIETIESALGGPTGPAYQWARNGRWRVVARAARADGKRVSLWAIPSRAGGWCWKVKQPGEGEVAACVPPARRPTIRFELVPSRVLSPNAELVATVGPGIARVAVRYASGAVAEVRPVHGLVLYAPPAGRVAARDSITALSGYDAAGKRVAHERLPGVR